MVVVPVSAAMADTAASVSPDTRTVESFMSTPVVTTSPPRRAGPPPPDVRRPGLVAAFGVVARDWVSGLLSLGVVGFAITSALQGCCRRSSAGCTS